MPVATIGEKISEKGETHLETKTGFKKYMCLICGLIYDEAEGWLEDGIVAGTRWEDIPEDWVCPECGASKLDFQMIEIN